DAATWTNATNHGYFLILNVAMGGGFPDAFGGSLNVSTSSAQASRSLQPDSSAEPSPSPSSHATSCRTPLT
ncbi:1,3-beta-glucanase, partial [Streptomyces sp. NPDC005141]